MALRTIPLFPLHTVLFPGTGLPLLVFEERYRELIHHCLDEHQLFGVVLIKEGLEVGGPATPFEVGTLAAIQRLNVHPDGRMDLLAVGVGRFRLQREVAGASYPQGEVELLDEAAEQVAPHLVADAASLLETYVEVLRTLNDPLLAVPCPPEPRQLSYVIGSLLRIDLATKQALLEASDTALRLELCAGHLRRELSFLQDFLKKAEGLGYFFFKGGRLSMN